MQITETMARLQEKTQAVAEIATLIQQLNTNADDVVTVIRSSVSAVESQNEMIGIIASTFEGLTWNSGKYCRA